MADFNYFIELFNSLMSDFYQSLLTYCEANYNKINSLNCNKSSNLVDSASSHMLVSKTKPCMSKYK